MIATALATASLDLHNLKISVVHSTGLAKDALHIYGGMALFLCVRLLWRRRGGWMLAWIAVLALACSVEWLDKNLEQHVGWPRPDTEHWHDIWNTMFWPTVLLLVGRWLQPATKSKQNVPLSASADQAANQPGKQTPSV